MYNNSAADGVSRKPDEQILILLSFPHQLLHALSAVVHLGLDNHKIIIFYWSYSPKDHFDKNAFCVLENMCVQFNNIKLVCPGYFSRQTVLSAYLPIKLRAKILRWKLSGNNFRYTFFSHDHSLEHIAQSFLQAWPKNFRICFGDPPGYLYSTPHQVTSEFSFSALLKKWRSVGLAEWFVADINLVAVKLYGRQDVLVPHKVLPKNILKATHKKICGSAAPFSKLLNHGFSPQKKNALLLLSNFSQSKMMSKTSELCMYSDEILFLSKKYNILIKPHPGNSIEFIKALKVKCRGTGAQIYGFDKALPAEVLIEVLDVENVFSFSSNIALLDKLSDVQLRFVITERVIDKFFYPEHKEYASENLGILKKFNRQGK